MKLSAHPDHEGSPVFTRKLRNEAEMRLSARQPVPTHGKTSMNAKYLIVFAVVAATAACQSSQENLQRATAMSVGNGLSPQSVNVSDVDRGMTSVTWNAATPLGRYACSADDMVRRPYCVKQ